MNYRIYIDESGDHSYRGLDNPGRRYLGLTGVAFHNSAYNPAVPLGLEELKRRHFPYDSDFPVILHRKDIVQRRREFRVLQEAERNRGWEAGLLDFLPDCPFRSFTVVFDKEEHLRLNPGSTENAYSRCFMDLLETISGWLTAQPDGTAEFLLESREAKSDRIMQMAYTSLRSLGTYRYSAEEFRTVFPEDALLFRGKEHNIAGLQVADIIVFDQTKLALKESGRPLAYPIGPFGSRLNEAIRDKAEAHWRWVIQ